MDLVFVGSGTLGVDSCPPLPVCLGGGVGVRGRRPTAGRSDGGSARGVESDLDNRLPSYDRLHCQVRPV